MLTHMGIYTEGSL